jgi:hypothetical protein
MRMSVENLLAGVVMNSGSMAIALRGGAAVFVVAVGCGAVAGVMASSSTSAAATTASSAISGETPAPQRIPVVLPVAEERPARCLWFRWLHHRPQLWMHSWLHASRYDPAPPSRSRQ